MTIQDKADAILARAERPAFTAGPWKMSERESQAWNSPSSRQRDIVREVQSEFGGTPTTYLLAHVVYPTSPVGTIGACEREANASLIAAAPEFYALLQRVVAHFDGTDAPLGIDAVALLSRIDGGTK